MADPDDDGTLTRSAIVSYAWVGYLGVSAVLAALYLFTSQFKGNGPLINLLGLSSPIAIVIGIRLHRPKAVAAWLLFAVGQFLFFAGDLYTYSYPKLLGADVPFPSPGDAIYLLVYPALMGGLLLLVRRRNPRRDWAGLIDSLILTIGVGLFSWVFLIAPNIHLSGLSLLATGVSIAYPLGDLLLLAAAIRLAVDTGKRAPAFYLLIGSIVCLFVTDSLYGYALLKGTYDHQLTLDAGWIAYYVLWGAAALHPSMRSLEQPSANVRARLTAPRLALLAGACLIAPGIRFVQDYGNADVVVLMIASAALFLLVVGRMAGLVRQEERAASRELALRNAGGQLVAAAGQEQIHDAAISAVHRLLGAEAGVRLALVSATGPMVVAGTDGGEDRPLLDSTWEWLDATESWLPIPLTEVPPAVCGELQLPPGDFLLAAAAVDAGRGPRPPRDLLPWCCLTRAARLTRGARHADLARPRGRLTDRGSAPSAERGAVPLARGAFERPHHRARRRRDRHLSEPIDRARARVQRRRDRRHAVRPAAARHRPHRSSPR